MVTCSGGRRLGINHSLQRAAHATSSRLFGARRYFALGVCNGCQMMSNCASSFPADAWPHFVRNKSEQFEARVAMVEVLPSPSIFLAE